MGQNSSKTEQDEWLEALCEHHPDIKSPSFWQLIEKNSTDWADVVSNDRFSKLIKENLIKWQQEYYQKHKSALLAENEENIKFIGKKADRIKEKLFIQYKKALADKRLSKDEVKNILLQSFNFSGSRDIPICCLQDLVRTRINCKYIDGVELLADKINELAVSEGISVDRKRIGEIQGYFAQHITLYQDIYYNQAGVRTPARVICEIQIATELSTYMWKVTHSLYEKNRRENPSPESWQWNSKDPQFIANQLSHMMHLADGLLIELRERTDNQGGTKK